MAVKIPVDSRVDSQALNPNNVAAKSPASRADRPLSFHVADFSRPSNRTEEWRFAPLRRLRPFFDTTAEQIRSSCADQAGVSLTADGIALETVARDDARLGKLQAPEDQLGALAWEGAPHAYVATLPADTELEREATVHLHGHQLADDTSVRAVEMLIDAGERSRGTILLTHTGSAALTEGVEIRVGDGAHLTLVSIQDWDDDALHALSFRMRLGTDATLKHIVVSLGGSVVRVTSALDYAGTGGDAELLGAYFADAGQHLEHRLYVDHNQPQCRSNALYKGALQGEGARAVWVGDVLIRPEAEGINTYELNRNLVLSDGPRADSVPNLEIETGKIEGAGHASATGRFDDEQLFYLLSRGIPEKEAHRLVVMGFFAELINQIGVPTVQEKLLTHIETTLDKLGQGAPGNAPAGVPSAPVSFSDAEIGRAASANEDEDDTVAHMG
ncbi:MAG: Fe-S cluster assembly protein SufD [Actinomycetaceae bacterium]|nr:Fe-S cluster assembly protein SufD [Arcanobacterium sp.]MDD7686490.1 Fe-S cluster assembly protein SufD [Actinomycetaceae bacterium]MDY5272770.1 Fe-S cluster assembly protein SufD [Arcanobacterium sp.]